MKKSRVKAFYQMCIGIYIVTLGYAFVVNWQGRYFGMTLVAMGMPFLAPLIMKIIKIKVPDEFYILNIMFIYFASLWGSCLGGYTTPYYDKIVHFVSGIMITEVAYLLYKSLLRQEKRTIVLVLFVNMLNASIALLWEFYEYALFVLFQYDAIRNVYGVHDTMTDMLVAVLGGILLTLYFVAYDNKDEDHFFVSLERKIYQLNHKKEM